MTSSVLIVCLGNICRSPMGEAVLRHVAAERGVDIKVDSAGTAAYHVGDDPDERTVKTCKQHKVECSHSGRQVSQQDYSEFDYMLAADDMNIENLTRRKPKGSKAEIRLFGSFGAGEPEAIADPYYGGMRGFESCYNQCVKFSNEFLDHLESIAASP